MLSAAFWEMAGLLSSFVPFVSSLAPGDLRRVGRGGAISPSRGSPLPKGSHRLPLVGYDVDLRGSARRVQYPFARMVTGWAGGQVVTGELISHRFRIEPDSAQSRLYRRAVGSLFLGCLVRLGGCILGFCSGVILIVARQGFRNLFRGELAVIFRMQYVG